MQQVTAAYKRKVTPVSIVMKVWFTNCRRITKQAKTTNNAKRVEFYVV